MNFLKKIVIKLRLKKYVYPVYHYLVVLPKLKKRTHDFRRSNKELLFLIDSVLTCNGYVYWLNFGTLLGAYRDHDFISYDNDLDIGMWYEKDYYKIINLFEKNGIKLVQLVNFSDPNCCEPRFVYKGVYVDINFYIHEDGNIVTYDYNFIKGITYNVQSGKTEFPVLVEKVINPYFAIGKIKFLNFDFPVPVDTCEYLKANYGESFMTPIVNFDYHDYATNIKCFDLKEKQAVLKFFP
uniref:LicD family protein n=1 Tax=uncultured Bacteroides sp. TaxID=162156 RepID=UPI00280BA67C|nr:LicD family protein [uncultured Bacteroides sp.]